MKFDTKIAIVVRADLPVWQKLNMTAFLASGIAIFTDPLFGTGHDEANRAALAALPPDQMTIAGFAVHGPKNDVDRALKGLKLHP